MSKGNSILSHAFSTREKVLIGILVVILLIAFYYFMIVRGVSDRIESNEAELSEIQTELDIQNSIAAQRTKMEDELDSLGDSSNLAVVAVYDNFNNEFDELNGILDNAISFDLKFSEPIATGSLVRRDVVITFTSNSYADAMGYVQKIQDGSYRCLTTDMTMSTNTKTTSTSAAGTITTTMSVTYFETTEGAETTAGLIYEDAE